MTSSCFSGVVVFGQLMCSRAREGDRTEEYRVSTAIEPQNSLPSADEYEPSFLNPGLKMGSFTKHLTCMTSRT